MSESATYEVLRTEYDPGEFIFDFYNGAQVRNLAQSLGIDLAQSREVTKETTRNGEVKLSVGPLGFGGGGGQAVATSTSLSGDLESAVFLSVAARLREELHLFSLSQSRVDGPHGMIKACEAASSADGWVIAEGTWELASDRLALRLAAVEDMAEPLGGRIGVEMMVPGEPADLTATGRLRFVPGRPIRATVFAHCEDWNPEERRLVGIAHAVFKRQGEPRYRWPGASFGDNSNGDF
jgi:hypothetical protein